MASKSSPSVQNVCLDVDFGDMVNGEEELSLNGKAVGVVNSPCYSHRMGKSLALGHVEPSVAVGDVLQVKGGDIDTTAKVVASPIYDPQKSRTHA